MIGKIERAVGCVLLASALLMIGCDSAANSETSETPTTANASQLPKKDFHRPKEFAAAVGRLQEMHAACLGESELPEPRTFDVVEVIHGEGASAHSHFYLADQRPASFEEEDGHDRDDHEMHESEKLHQVSVDFFTEFKDLVDWLPEMAADSDLNETQWKAVEDTANELRTELASVFSASQSADRRQAYQAKAEAVASGLKRLEEICAAAESQ